MLDLEISCEVEEFKYDMDGLNLIFERFGQVMNFKIEEYLGLAKGKINLIFVDDNKIHEINRTYRSKDKPTDVISFAYLESNEFNEKECAVGDIFISCDTAKNQAIQRGHSLDKEIMILFVHGLLHLFGYDHNDDEEEKEMEKYAREVLGF